MTERKSSDILLELESMMTESLGLLRNIDNNLKQLLNQKNISEQAMKVLQETQQQLQQVPKPPALSASQIIVETPASPVEEPKPSTSSVDFPQVNQVPQHGMPRTVQEKVLYKDSNKIILLAQVEIFTQDSQGNLKLVKKTRTNNQGAWTAKLRPGTYKVRVAKQAVQNKPAVGVTYDILVTEGVKPLQLESRKL